KLSCLDPPYMPSFLLLVFTYPFVPYTLIPLPGYNPHAIYIYIYIYIYMYVCMYVWTNNIT
ncbi:MAG: hypothetical protein N7Q72_06305, partial [Spiroplasma sp. Tabriz.8]|nr:hypothetical protein [Spiroplasma sp. Tabriz.8]